MKKKLAFLLVLLLSIFSFSACSNGDSKATRENSVTIEPDINAIKEQIENEIEFPEMVDATKENFEFLYDDIDDESVEEFSLIYAGSGGYSDEIAVIKVKSAEDIKNVEIVMLDRVEKRLNDFKGYAPLEYEKLSNAVVTINGDFAFLAVCDNPDKAEKIFNDAFK